MDRMAGGLPTFRYHPDPIATGFVEPSPDECRGCGRARGFKYVGPVYAEQELVDAFCPWCIADGSAARKFDAEFTDIGWGVPTDVPAAVTDEIAHRTPGFHSWQQDHWLYHCGDGCAFLGEVGEPNSTPIQMPWEALRRESESFRWDDGQITDYLNSLTRGGSTTA